MPTNETLRFSNVFGSVTDHHVILQGKDGIEHVSLNQISSVKYRHVRNYVFSIGGFAVAIAVLIFMVQMISKMPGVGVLICCVLIIVGILSGLANWVGHHEIMISIQGNDRKPIKAELAKTREGREFVNAILKGMER